MKKLIAFCVCFALLFSFTSAFATRQYIITDSDSRELNWAEITEWDYESIGFIFNEIFARHGYNFNAGQQFDRYFSTRPWYTPNANSDNTVACYPKLSSIEWYNEKLCKEVRKYMRDISWFNPEGKNFRNYMEWGFDVLDGFVYTKFSPNQKFKIYSAPDENSYRGANGKALVSTNGAVYIAGIENAWYLCMYETNSGAVRVGYFNSSQTKNKPSVPMLEYEYSKVEALKQSFITDDPATNSTKICNIAKGETLIYLDSYFNANHWAYVQTNTPQGQLVRGFMPLNDLNIINVYAENEK